MFNTASLLKSLPLMIGLSLIVNTLSAQSLVSAGGGSGAVPGGTMSWSIGESVIGAGNVPGGRITQGYQQPIKVRVRLNIAAVLEGPYNNSTGLMADGVRAAGLVPLVEPYTALGYTHVGGGAEVVSSPAILNVTGSNAIVDWVVVELRNAASPATRVETRCALLQRDGDVVALDGFSPVSFNASPANYMVALRHRNHLGVMSLNPIAVSANTPALNFASAGTATYGTSARKSVTGTFPAQALWAGDVTFNGQVKYTGSGNDRDPILTTVGSTTPNNTVSIYSTRDVNLNGQVKYTGSANDRDPILVNVGSTTPNNVRTQQLP